MVQAGPAQDAVSDQDWLVVGALRSPHGLKGYLWLWSDTDPRDQIFAYAPWTLRLGTREQCVEIEDWRPQGKGWVLRCKGWQDRDSAEIWVGAQILVQRSVVLGAVGADEYLWSELLGARVSSVDGQDLGVVHAMMETGANDVLVVQGDVLSMDRRERLIPWIVPDVIVDVDRQRRRITVDWDVSF